MVVAFYFRLHLAYFPRPVVAIFARPEHRIKNENRTSKLPYTPYTLYGIFQLHPQNTVLLVPLVKQFTASCKICR